MALPHANIAQLAVLMNQLSDGELPPGNPFAEPHPGIVEMARAHVEEHQAAPGYEWILLAGMAIGYAYAKATS